MVILLHKMIIVCKWQIKSLVTLSCYFMKSQCHIKCAVNIIQFANKEWGLKMHVKFKLTDL
jgi:hypothetical protein